MTLTVEVGGITRTLEVRRAGSRWLVCLDGCEHAVDAHEVEPGRWSLLVGETRCSLTVRVQADRPGCWTVFLNRDAAPLIVCDPGRAAAGRIASAARTAASGPVRITAPMPGKVVRVLIKPGETVAARQAVAVVEAMKMENELRAPRVGTVTEVFAREGASVDAGAVLLLIE